jgi:hypothetical protein
MAATSPLHSSRRMPISLSPRMVRLCFPTLNPEERLFCLNRIELIIQPFNFAKLGDYGISGKYGILF